MNVTDDNNINDDHLVFTRDTTNVLRPQPYDYAMVIKTTGWHPGVQVLFSIRCDGTIERGPAFTTIDEMSLEFWKAVERCSPARKTAQ